MIYGKDAKGTRELRREGLGKLIGPEVKDFEFRFEYAGASLVSLHGVPKSKGC
jgi:hypothetical protein